MLDKFRNWLLLLSLAVYDMYTSALAKIQAEVNKLDEK